MNAEDEFLEDIGKGLAALRGKVEDRRVKLQAELKLFWEHGEQTDRDHELGDLLDRMEFVSEHLYLSGEYLAGNGEGAMVQFENPDQAMA
ncbi:hypothetical protein FACS1894130_09460 [Spirochaetia bacterium]|nr:hypothetical protein FACS1894130_09460 [Spirochaetia bacterium]